MRNGRFRKVDETYVNIVQKVNKYKNGHRTCEQFQRRTLFVEFKYFHGVTDQSIYEDTVKRRKGIFF